MSKSCRLIFNTKINVNKIQRLTSPGCHCQLKYVGQLVRYK